MRFSWRSEWPHLVLLAGMFGLALASWEAVPDRVPVHWNFAGEVDRWGGRFEGLLAVPLLALAMYALFLWLPRLDPGRASYTAFAGAYATLRLAILVMMAALHGLTTLAARGVPVRIETWVPLIVGALFVVVGNVLPRVRPNWFVGVRNPWTLSSEATWTRTHRAGRWVFVALGVLLMALAVVRAPWAGWLTLGVGAVLLIGLNVYSYVVWRGDPRKTPPPGTPPGTAAR